MLLAPVNPSVSIFVLKLMVHMNNLKLFSGALQSRPTSSVSKPRHGIIQVTVIHALGTIILGKYTVLNIHFKIIQPKSFSFSDYRQNFL